MCLNTYWLGIKEGDEKSLESLFREVNRPLCYYCYYMTRDFSIAEEIVQDVFLKIWQERDKINIKGSFKSYLYRAVRNNAINHLIHKKTRKHSVEMLQSEEVWQDLQEVLNIDEYIIEKIEASETEDKIREIVKSLPEQCQKIFVLSRFELKSDIEIAKELKISVNTVKTQIYRALSNIKRDLF